MKTLICTLGLLFIAGVLSELHAESFLEKIQREGCENSCESTETRATDTCVEESKKKGETKGAFEPICKAAGKKAKERCISECISK